MVRGAEIYEEAQREAVVSKNNGRITQAKGFCHDMSERQGVRDWGALSTVQACLLSVVLAYAFLVVRGAQICWVWSSVVWQADLLAGW